MKRGRILIVDDQVALAENIAEILQGVGFQTEAAGSWLFLPKPVPLPALIQAFDSLAQQPASALVVDDEQSLAENLAEALTAAGHEVVIAHTVADALAQNRRIHTAVLDVRLPDGSG